jgi:hypothetical protein
MLSHLSMISIVLFSFTLWHFSIIICIFLLLSLFLLYFNKQHDRKLGCADSLVLFSTSVLGFTKIWSVKLEMSEQLYVHKAALFNVCVCSVHMLVTFGRITNCAFLQSKH